jgi:thiol-disulfide isomerase/thioredoxin
MPRVALKGLEHEPAVTTDALVGGALVINFWASWCVPCRSEMPALQRLSRRTGPQAARVVGVSVDSDLNLAREFVRAYGLTFPNYADGADKALQRALGVKALPATVLVTADGRIAARIVGARAWDEEEGARLLQRAFGNDGAATP